MDDTTFLIELQNVSNELNAYAIYLTRGRTEDARELFQATVVRAYIKRKYFTPGTRFNLWVKRIMRNIFLNEQLSVQRRVRTENVDYNYYRTDDAADALLEFRDVARIIAKFPPEFSTPLIMYARGFKYCEIAITLGLPLSTVKNRIHAARLLLKKAFKE